MKTLLSTLAITMTVVGIAQADMLSGASVTDRFLSGALDTRLEEIGTNFQTGEKMPQWKMTQLAGVRRHCVQTLVARGVKDTSGCKRETR